MTPDVVLISATQTQRISCMKNEPTRIAENLKNEVLRAIRGDVSLPRIHTNWQNFLDRRRVGKLGRVCSVLLHTMGTSRDDFLDITNGLCVTSQGKRQACIDNSALYPNKEPSIKIWQIFYRPDQFSTLDPAFEPYEWLCNPHPEYTETLHLVNLYESGRYKECDYVGFVSNKFGLKTGLAGERFIQFIRDNPGHDVYFVNPFPELGYFWLNVWTQGEFRHPGLTALTQKLFETTHTKVQVEALGRNNHEILLYSNYWVGNAKFWDAFMGFVIPIFRWIDQEATPHEKRPYFKKAPYADAGFSMFSFIFERLFSTFLLTNPHITGLGYRFSSHAVLAKCGNDAYRNFIQMFGAFIDRLDQLTFRCDNLGTLSLEILKNLMTLEIDVNSVTRFHEEILKS